MNTAGIKLRQKAVKMAIPPILGVGFWCQRSTRGIDTFPKRKLYILTKGINFSIRQPIPLPEFMGTPGRWEALVDVRNLFDNGRASLPARDGKLVLYRNPRTVRFGINLNLY